MSFTFLYLLLDDPRDKHQKKIRSKTQDFLNLYAADGLRTLCIAKKVSTGNLLSGFPGEGFQGRVVHFHWGRVCCSKIGFKAIPSTAVGTMKPIWQDHVLFVLLAQMLSLQCFPLSRQVLKKEDYACWLKSHIEAESSIDNRDELLFQSATRLETDLHLLGNS